MEKIGRIDKMSWTIEWKIDDFLSDKKKNKLYHSPDFHVCNSIWHLKINPKCMEFGDKYVSLFVYRIHGKAPLTIEFEFGIQTSRQTVVNVHKTDWIPNDNDWGYKKFIKRSELELNKSVMLPFGTLTVVWSVKVKNNVPDLDTGLSKLAADFKEMFISKKNTDVTIKVMDETFTAHKCCLAARSPVLAALFENDMIEKKTGLVNIPDCDPKAFRIFLLYLYSGIVNLEECDVFHLYKISDKYEVSELRLMCVNFIIQNLCANNFFESYVLACTFNEDKLLSKVQSFFEDNFETIISSNDWEDFFKENFALGNNLLKRMAPKFSIKK